MMIWDLFMLYCPGCDALESLQRDDLKRGSTDILFPSSPESYKQEVFLRTALLSKLVRSPQKNNEKCVDAAIGTARDRNHRKYSFFCATSQRPPQLTNVGHS